MFCRQLQHLFQQQASVPFHLNNPSPPLSRAHEIVGAWTPSLGGDVCIGHSGADGTSTAHRGREAGSSGVGGGDTAPTAVAAWSLRCLQSVVFP